MRNQQRKTPPTIVFAAVMLLVSAAARADYPVQSAPAPVITGFQINERLAGPAKYATSASMCSGLQAQDQALEQLGCSWQWSPPNYFNPGYCFQWGSNNYAPNQGYVYTATGSSYGPTSPSCSMTVTQDGTSMGHGIVHLPGYSASGTAIYACPLGATPHGSGATLTCTQSCPNGGQSGGQNCLVTIPLNAGPSCPVTHNPIHIGTGNKYWAETDFFEAGNSGFKWTRTYNSLLSGQPPMIAPQWSHSYARWIQLESSTVANVWRPDGSLRIATAVGTPSPSSLQPWTFGTAKTEQAFRLFDSTTTAIGWLVYSPDDQVEELYDPVGNLTTIAKWSGYAVLVKYSDGSTYGGYVLNADGTPTTTALPAGLQIAVTDAFLRKVTIGYDSLNRVVKVTDPMGQAYLYSYDSNSNLTAVTYPDGKNRQYLYNETALTGGAWPHALTGIIDENGTRMSSYTYDSQGRATNSTWWADAAQSQAVDSTTVTYASSTSSVVTDAFNTSRSVGLTTVGGLYRSTGQTQPGGSGCGPAATDVTFDTNGNVASRTDFDGNLSCYSADLTRNVELARLEGVASGGACPANLSTYVPASGTAQRLIQTQWHPIFRLKAREAAPLKITTWVYNGQPDPTNNNAALTCAPSTAALPDGNPIAVLCKKVEQATTDATGAAGFNATATGSPRVWTYTYNQFGQILSAKSPRTDLNSTTTYQYYVGTDGAHTPPWYHLGDRQSVTDALGNVTQFTRYDGNGKLLEQVDPNGVTTDYVYYPRGWLQTVTVTQSGGGSSLVTSYSYDGAGQLQQTTLPDASYVKNTYDAAHRLIEVTDSAGDTVNYTLDVMGNRQGEQWKDPGGTLRRNIARSYDALNRLQQITGGQQ